MRERMSVVFPSPEAPIKNTNSPGLISISTSLRTILFRKLKVTESIFILKKQEKYKYTLKSMKNYKKSKEALFPALALIFFRVLI